MPSPLRRLAVVLAALAGLVLAGMPSTAGVPAPAASSRSLTSLGLLPDHVGGASSMVLRGARLFVLDATSVSVYDVRRPETPALIGRLRTGKRHFANALQVSADGTRMLLPHAGYLRGSDDALVVYDVTPDAGLRQRGVLRGFPETVYCVDDCRWGYGRAGSVLDLRDADTPRVVARAGASGAWNRRAGLKNTSAAHLEQVRPGVLVAALTKGIFDDRILPLPVLDVRDPRRPRVLAAAASPSERESFVRAQWPQQGRDRFLLAQTVFNGEDLFCTSDGGFVTYERTAAGRFVQRARFGLQRGTYVDGSPAANPLLNCGGGRFDAHPGFRNGGLVLTGQLEHGVRAVRVGGSGTVTEVGHHLPVASYVTQVLFASRNAQERIAFALDSERGVEVLRWDGDL